MSQDVVINFGETDSYNIKGKTALPLIKKNILDLSLGLEGVRDKLYQYNATPSEISVDLLTIAISVYYADVSIKRNEFEDEWTRSIHLHIPVSDKKLWQAHADHLESMLKFLTGDYWEFSFRSPPKERKDFLPSTPKLQLNNYESVSLFSGGLDSLIGAIDLLKKNKKTMFISHYWDPGTKKTQEFFKEKLDGKYSVNQYSFLSARIGDKNEEPSQRSRSFLFYSMAAIAADANNCKEVLIPENAFIALNVPIDLYRYGSLSTRTAHPFFINEMCKLSSLVGLGINFSNPYAFKTKGQMVKECLDLAFLKKLIPYSMSCSSPNKHRFQKKTFLHCGHCVPCIIRQASLRHGLGANGDTTKYYLTMPKNRTLDSTKAEGMNVRSFLYTIENIKRENSRRLVMSPGPLPQSDVTKYAKVYWQGIKEIKALLSGVKSRRK